MLRLALICLLLVTCSTALAKTDGHPLTPRELARVFAAAAEESGDPMLRALANQLETDPRLAGLLCARLAEAEATRVEPVIDDRGRRVMEEISRTYVEGRPLILEEVTESSGNRRYVLYDPEFQITIDAREDGSGRISVMR